MDLPVKKLYADAVLPFRASAGAAAADLSAYLPEGDVFIAPGERVLIPTGIAIALPSEEFVALIFARSSLGNKNGIALASGVGVVDSDYRGEIRVGLINQAQQGYTVHNGDRIAQLAVVPVLLFNCIETQELGETARGVGGFGSTGR